MVKSTYCADVGPNPRLTVWWLIVRISYPLLISEGTCACGTLCRHTHINVTKNRIIHLLKKEEETFKNKKISENKIIKTSRKGN